MNENYQPESFDKAFSKRFNDKWVEGYETKSGIVITNVISGWSKLFAHSPRSKKSNHRKRYEEPL